MYTHLEKKNENKNASVNVVDHKLAWGHYCLHNWQPMKCWQENANLMHKFQGSSPETLKGGTVKIQLWNVIVVFGHIVKPQH